MGGASKGRVAKKQRPAKSPSQTTASATSNGSETSARSMRRSHARRSHAQAFHAEDVNRAAIEEMFLRFREPQGMLIADLFELGPPLFLSHIICSGLTEDG